MEKLKSLVQVFWGDGKGKTTSALGAALRACGNGYKVHLVQFMKNGSGNKEISLPGEIMALEKFQNFSFKRFGTGNWIIGKPNNEDIGQINLGIEYMKECFEKDYDLIIADEILYAVQLGFIKEEEIIELIKKKPSNKELILTGSHKPLSKIFALADLISEIKKIKHPYDQGIIARKGIEY